MIVSKGKAMLSGGLQIIGLWKGGIIQVCSLPKMRFDKYVDFAELVSRGKFCYQRGDPV